MIDPNITLNILKTVSKNNDANSLQDYINRFLHERTGFVSISPLDQVKKLEYEDFVHFICIGISLQELFDVEFEFSDILILKKESNNSLFLLNDKYYSSTSNVCIHFISPPAGMFNFVVHPLQKSTCSVYMLGIYLLAKHSKETAQPFCEMLGGSFKDLLFEAIDKEEEFSQFLNKLILSQYPSLKEFIKIFMFDKIDWLEKSSARFQPLTIQNIPKEETFQSPSLQKLCKKPISSSQYDHKLINLFHDSLKKTSNPITIGEQFNFFKYPIEKEIYQFSEEYINEELIHFIKLTKSYHIFIKAILTTNDPTKILLDDSLQLDKYIQIRKQLYQMLKPLYFSYHMSLHEFNYFYKFDTTYLFYFLAKINELDENLFVNFLQEVEEVEFINEDGKIEKYIPTYTLNQIYHLYSSNTMDQFISLVIKILFGGVVSKTFWKNKLEQYFDKAIEEEKSDWVMYQDLCKMHQDSQKKIKTKLIEYDRGESRVKDIEKLGIINWMNSSSQYLDFGGGIGDIAASMAKRYGMQKENVFVTDIKDWFGQEHIEKYKDYVTYRYLKVNKLPFMNNQFDFITCFQVLHHVPIKQVEYVVEELVRIMNVGGHILFREHDCNSIETKMLIDVEHALYNFCHDKDTSMTFLQDYDEHYFSKQELETILKKYLTPVKLAYEEPKGVTRYYYTCWKKQQTTDKKEIQEQKNNQELKLEASNKNVKKQEYAFAWLLMRGDSYTPGIFTSVHSIARTKKCSQDDFNTVVMVTPDVSEEAIIELKKKCDYIVRIDYLQHSTKAMRTEKQRELYGSWIDVSYTKWRCLCLPFKKIIFLDADVIALDSISSLFLLSTPAGHFSSAFAKPCGKMKNPYVDKSIIGDDGYARHGITISKDMIEEGLYNKLSTVHATSIVLKPSVEDFNKYVNMLETEFKNGFGFDTNSGADEQSIVYYYSIYKNGPNKLWTNIHQRYNFHSWKTERFLKNEMPYVIHFMSQPKVWKMKVSEYEDLVNWYIMFVDALEKENDNSFFIDVIKNIDQKNFSKDNLLKVCKSIPQKYITSFSTKFKNLSSCLDLVCKINVDNKPSWDELVDEEIELSD